MNYYFDTEFNQRLHKPWFGKSHHFLELISIGIVAEDGREYFAISSDFDLHAAWNKWQKAECCNIPELCGSNKQGLCNGYEKEYWLRENVLRRIWQQLEYTDYMANPTMETLTNTQIFNNLPESERLLLFIKNILEPQSFYYPFHYHILKGLIEKYGKSKKQIAGEIFNFVNPDLGFHCSAYNNSELCNPNSSISKHFEAHNVKAEGEHFIAQPEFYAYYAAYDWVIFCELFSSMQNLPKGFPYYCRDLKQMKDETQLHFTEKKIPTMKITETIDIKEGLLPDSELYNIEQLTTYPTQQNEHCAMDNARWNKKLFHFLINPMGK